ncbi:MAG: SPFH domain-containing protein [Tannerellaceae bacterium]|jgi:membrane protease subunit (stomatin/prohibitin family)|nr:SPFH domain-containing protein [Tannerellaceae bacterium]
MALYRNITWKDGYFTPKVEYKARKRGVTWDGQDSGQTNEGIVGAPIYWRPSSNGEIVYKYPFDNIRNGAAVIVHQTQRAFLFLNGAMVSSIPSTGEPYRLTTANIPYLRHFLNVPTGDTTAHTAEIWFINVETEREAPWGMGNLPVYDYSIHADFIIGAHGRFNLRITDAELFIKKLVGTLHDFTTDDVLEYFRNKISSIAAQDCSEIMEREKLSLSSIQRSRTGLEKQIEERINETLYMYGIKINNFAIRSFKIPEEYYNVLSAQSKGVAERKRLEQLGIDYTKERQLEIMLKAAGNEGSGTIMAAGIGANVAAGVTPLFGPYMNNTAGLVLPPSPPPLPVYYFYIGNVQSGPFTMNEILQLIHAGKITPDSLYWCQGMQQWQSISSSTTLRGLFNSL